MLIAFAVIIGLSILILGHEAGHFVVAKLFKLKVDEFGVGFPPRMFGARRYRGQERTPVAIERETVDVVRQDTEEMVMVEREIDVVRPVTKWRFFWRKEPLGGVERLQPSDTTYSFNWLPFGGFVKIAGENDTVPTHGDAEDTAMMHHSGMKDAVQVVGEEEQRHLFSFQPAWKRALVIAAGVVTNFVLGWLLLSIVLMIGSAPSLAITGIQPNSPAAQAGIQAGDVIVGFVTAQSFISFTDAHRGEPVTVTVRRGGGERSFTVTPRVKTAANEGAIGIAIAEAGVAREGFFPALRDGFVESLLIAKTVVLALAELVYQLIFNRSLLEGVAGPIGIFAVAQETGRIGFIYLVNLMALISVNLTIMNLVPFPALDGGRLLLIAIEKAKGSPLSKKTEAWANGIGFAFLILLMVLVSIRDVYRLL